MQRTFIEIQYDGTPFSGWQIQPNGITVQETIEKVLTAFNSNKPIQIVGCGRTDAGVHASYFIFHFDKPVHWNNKDLVYKMNKMLPNAIVVKKCMAVIPEAHARFDATERAYDYFIHYNKSPFINLYSTYYPFELDIVAMNQAAQFLIGTQDFECFSKVHTDVKTFICTITYAEWKTTEHGIVFTIRANRFLRNMVRAVVGTLLEIGRGNQPPDFVRSVIKSKSRAEAGESVPACGLFLSDVKYPANIYLE